jgi:hypothetical protein
VYFGAPVGNLNEAFVRRFADSVHYLLRPQQPFFACCIATIES